MASGKKNYFRHSFFARNDMKLKLLRDKIGVGFYFYYFTLLEQCGEASSDELMCEYEFHDSTIRNLWGVNLKKSERVANEMMSVDLLVFEKREKTFWFAIPKLTKYLGRYTIKNETNTPKESKRKESKRKETNGSNLYEFEMDLLDFWHSELSNKKLKPVMSKKTENNYIEIKAMLKKTKFESVDDIKQGIINYGTVLDSDGWYSHRWDIFKFIGQKNGIQFSPERFVLENYLEREQKDQANFERRQQAHIAKLKAFEEETCQTY